MLVANRRTSCNVCVQVCPIAVFDAVPGARPVIARQANCQTCFVCDLHCPVDALYAAPCCGGPIVVNEAEVTAASWLGQYWRDSGYGADRNDPAHANESWRMDEVFTRAREIAKEA